MNDALVSIRRVSKRYGGVAALDDVSFDVKAGEIHAVVGENGAGKSTLMKILAGAVRRDAGEILLAGESVDIGSPVEAHRLGIGIVHQETMLADNLTVAENIFLGHDEVPFFLTAGRLGARAATALEPVGAQLDPATPVASLTVGQKQLVQIARALAFSARLLILDEPTASLSDHEAGRLASVLRDLADGGMTLLYVSHKLPEIRQLASAATVLRDGRLVSTVCVEDTSDQEFIRLMVGRDVEVKQYEHADSHGPEVLGVKGLSSRSFEDISFRVHEREVVGCFGLVGSGRTEVARAIFGVDAVESGEIRLRGEHFVNTSPEICTNAGIAFLPEDRRQQGLVRGLSTRMNITLASLRKLSRRGLIQQAAERQVVAEAIDRLSIRCSSAEQLAGKLSGGNQQKVVFGKCLTARPKLLILDEPTKGVDVGAKAEIHDLVRELANDGLAILLISSELPEVQALSDRVLVFSGGRIVTELAHGEATDEEIMTHAAGESGAPSPSR